MSLWTQVVFPVCLHSGNRFSEPTACVWVNSWCRNLWVSPDGWSIQNHCFPPHSSPQPSHHFTSCQKTLPGNSRFFFQIRFHQTQSVVVIPCVGRYELNISDLRQRKKIINKALKLESASSWVTLEQEKKSYLFAFVLIALQND